MNQKDLETILEKLYQLSESNTKKSEELDEEILRIEKFVSKIKS